MEATLRRKLHIQVLGGASGISPIHTGAWLSKYGVSVVLYKRILYGELQAGARSHGGQKKCFRDNTLKVSMKDFNVDPAS